MVHRERRKACISHLEKAHNEQDWQKRTLQGGGLLFPAKLGTNTSHCDAFGPIGAILVVLGHFGPFWAILVVLGPFWVIFGFWGHFVSFLGFGVILGDFGFWGHFG